MIRIMHLGDVHLDSAFADFSADKRQERRGELREAFARVCEVCRSESVDVMLICGDLFESEYLSPDTPSFVADCLSRIPKTRVFISPGNHDPYTDKSPYRAASFPGNVHIFENSRISSVDIPELNTTVYGFGFNGASIPTSPLEGFTVKDRSRINILCAHGDLASSSPYCAISPDELTTSLLDYAALGHIHTPGPFTKYGKTVTAYSGCLVGRGFDECGPRGFITGELSLSSASLKRRTVLDRLCECVKVSLDGIGSNERALECIGQALSKFGKDCSKISVKITLCGGTSCELSLTESAVRLAFPNFSELYLCDESYFMPSYTDYLSEQSLRGEIARRVGDIVKCQDEKAEKNAALAFRLIIKAMRGEL